MTIAKTPAVINEVGSIWNNVMTFKLNFQVKESDEHSDNRAKDKTF